MKKSQPPGTLQYIDSDLNVIYYIGNKSIIYVVKGSDKMSLISPLHFSFQPN